MTQAGVNVKCELLDARSCASTAQGPNMDDNHGLSYDGGGQLTVALLPHRDEKGEWALYDGGLLDRTGVTIASNGRSSHMLNVTVAIDKRVGGAVRRALLLVLLRRKIATATAARSLLRRIVGDNGFDQPFDFADGSMVVSPVRSYR